MTGGGNQWRSGDLFGVMAFSSINGWPPSIVYYVSTLWRDRDRDQCW